MIRKASASQVHGIKSLIDYWAMKGEILPRDEGSIKSGINDFVVLEENDCVVATAAVVAYTENLAEIRSLCVHPDHHGKGFGKQIVIASENEAKSRGVNTVFVLTRKPGFFAKLGFENGVVRGEKVYKDCIACPLYNNGCDESYMEKKI